MSVTGLCPSCDTSPAFALPPVLIAGTPRDRVRCPRSDPWDPYRLAQTPRQAPTLQLWTNAPRSKAVPLASSTSRSPQMMAIRGKGTKCAARPRCPVRHLRLWDNLKHEHPMCELVNRG